VETSDKLFGRPKYSLTVNTCVDCAFVFLLAMIMEWSRDDGGDGGGIGGGGSTPGRGFGGGGGIGGGGGTPGGGFGGGGGIGGGSGTLGGGCGGGTGGGGDVPGGVVVVVVAAAVGSLKDCEPTLARFMVDHVI